MLDRDKTQDFKHGVTPDDLADAWRRRAVVSRCGNYRPWLLRDAGGGGDSVCIFVMLNPSTADAELDDPTVRHCVGFAEREGARWLVVVNLFSGRSKNPQNLYEMEDPVGPDADVFIEQAFRSVRPNTERLAHGGPIDRAVCAWGVCPPMAPYWFQQMRRDRVAFILEAADRYGVELTCLGFTDAKSQPRHPLYVMKKEPLVPFGTAIG